MATKTRAREEWLVVDQDEYDEYQSSEENRESHDMIDSLVAYGFTSKQPEAFIREHYAE